jgi:hypothetical protein
MKPTRHEAHAAEVSAAEDTIERLSPPGWWGKTGMLPGVDKRHVAIGIDRRTGHRWLSAVGVCARRTYLEHVVLGPGANVSFNASPGDGYDIVSIASLRAAFSAAEQQHLDNIEKSWARENDISEEAQEHLRRR